MMHRFHSGIATGLTLAALLASQTAQAACQPSNSNLQNTKPDDLYVDHDDGTVTDKETGLMWTRCALGLDYEAQSGGGGMDCNSGNGGSATDQSDWEDAISAVNTQNTDELYGYDDWRLPNIKELASLVDLACAGNSTSSANQKSLNDDIFDVNQITLNGTVPTQTQLTTLWSSTPNPNSAGEVMALQIHDGTVVKRDKGGTSGETSGVLMVRDPD